MSTYSHSFAIVSAGLLVLCAIATGPIHAADADSFKAAYSAAESARKQAASAGFEWRDTKKMLKKAQELAEKGQFEKAEKLAMEAKRQGELGVLQAKQQAEAWKAAVLR